MHKHFSFDFLKTISEQLYAELETNLGVTVLNPDSLTALRDFQTSNQSLQGVYVVYYKKLPMYVGKANDIYDRLSQHHEKLSGRLNIDLNQIGYKAIYLDKSMSTAANEGLMLMIYNETYNHQMWNGGGFGPKDPGKNRDNTEPGYFDRNFPIIANFTLTSVSDLETVQSLFTKMKSELPFVFRHQRLESAIGRIPVDLSRVPKTALELFRTAIKLFPRGWQGAVISYGMVAYRNAGRVYYEFADEVVLPKRTVARKRSL
ncbi:GIY-YIG nuclease family protein [Geothrix sp. 21YS21S-2]|uniref:GIY-YIG nuclease family protein n=1 Tax=Geothrix sp. 21YS21S-2 TaxID=3068893 RepID=UPI0027BAF273|nr:GIY-YIG nuclease family protein [Geothrix sp. 21YS21S-2]